MRCSPHCTRCWASWWPPRAGASSRLPRARPRREGSPPSSCPGSPGCRPARWRRALPWRASHRRRWVPGILLFSSTRLRWDCWLSRLRSWSRCVRVVYRHLPIEEAHVRLPFILFLIFPFIEIMILLRVADEIGGWNTVLIVLLTAGLGIALLRHQGFNTWQRFQNRMQSGQMPAQEIIEGMLLAFCGAMLLAPGLLTDTVGIVCLLSPVRRRIAQRILRSGGFFMMSGFQGNFYRGPGPGGPTHGDVFDAKYRDETHPDPALPDEHDRKPPQE